MLHVDPDNLQYLQLVQSAYLPWEEKFHVVLEYIEWCIYLNCFTMHYNYSLAL